MPALSPKDTFSLKAQVDAVRRCRWDPPTSPRSVLAWQSLVDAIAKMNHHNPRFSLWKYAKDTALIPIALEIVDRLLDRRPEVSSM